MVISKAGLVKCFNRISIWNLSSLSKFVVNFLKQSQSYSSRRNKVIKLIINVGTIFFGRLSLNVFVGISCVVCGRLQRMSACVNLTSCLGKFRFIHTHTFSSFFIYASKMVVKRAKWIQFNRFIFNYDDRGEWKVSNSHYYFGVTKYYSVALFVFSCLSLVCSHSWNIVRLFFGNFSIHCTT